MGDPFHLKKKEKEEGREGESLIRKSRVELLCLRQA